MTPHSVPELGLGCSRFGSLTRGVDRAAAQRLVFDALDLGIRLFDTADIYGQGDSERFLGAALRQQHDVRIVTKAGQRFSPFMRAMTPVKRIMKPLVRHVSAAGAIASASRAGRLPMNLSRQHLTAAIEQSLRRLRRDAVDMFLLHSPTAAELRASDALDTAAQFKVDGKAKFVGISVDDIGTAEMVVNDHRIDVVQLPLSLGDRDFAVIAQRARASGRIVIAREILRSVDLPRDGDAALAFAAKQPVDIALIGTSRTDRLRAAQAIFAHTLAAKP